MHDLTWYVIREGSFKNIIIILGSTIKPNKQMKKHPQKYGGPWKISNMLLKVFVIFIGGEGSEFVSLEVVKNKENLFLTYSEKEN